MTSQKTYTFILEKLAASTIKTKLQGITTQNTNPNIRYHENTIPEGEDQYIK
jgi:hypothetical protein